MAEFHAYVTDNYTEEDMFEEEAGNVRSKDDDEETSNTAIVTPTNNEEVVRLIGPSYLHVERQGSELDDDNTEKLTRILKQLKEYLRQYQSAVRLKTRTEKFSGEADFGTAATLVEHINMFLEELAAPGLKSIVLVALNGYGKSHLLNLLLHLGESLPSKYGKQNPEETLEKIVRQVCEESPSLYENEGLHDAEAMNKFVKDIFDIYHMENNDEDDTFDNAKNKNGAPLRATTTTTTTKATTRYEKKIKNQRAQHLGKKGFVIVEANEDLYADLSHPEQVKDERDALEDLKKFPQKRDKRRQCVLLLSFASRERG